MLSSVSIAISSSTSEVKLNSSKDLYLVKRSRRWLEGDRMECLCKGSPGSNEACSKDCLCGFLLQPSTFWHFSATSTFIVQVERMYLKIRSLFVTYMSMYFTSMFSKPVNTPCLLLIFIPVWLYSACCLQAAQATVVVENHAPMYHFKSALDAKWRLLRCGFYWTLFWLFINCIMSHSLYNPCPYIWCP